VVSTDGKMAAGNVESVDTAPIFSGKSVGESETLCLLHKTTIEFA
jgi:hypothetical protein